MADQRATHAYFRRVTAVGAGNAATPVLARYNGEQTYRDLLEHAPGGHRIETITEFEIGDTVEWTPARSAPSRLVYASGSGTIAQPLDAVAGTFGVRDAAGREYHVDAWSVRALEENNDA